MRGWFSREYQPVETVEPGGSVSFQARNAGWKWDPVNVTDRPQGGNQQVGVPTRLRGKHGSLRIDADGHRIDCIKRFVKQFVGDGSFLQSHSPSGVENPQQEFWRTGCLQPVADRFEISGQRPNRIDRAQNRGHCSVRCSSKSALIEPVKTAVPGA